MKRTSLRPRLVVTADERGVVNHAGARMLVDLADVTGLSAAVSEALAPLRFGPARYHVAVPLVTHVNS